MSVKSFCRQRDIWERTWPVSCIGASKTASHIYNQIESHKLKDVFVEKSYKQT